MTQLPFPVADVQGFALAGFRKDHQRLLAVTFGPDNVGRRVVARLADEAATFAEVHAFNELFHEVRLRRSKPGDDGEVLASLWVAGLISAAGLTALGQDPTQGAPATPGAAAFQAGMAARGSQIGDGPASAWVPGIAGAHCLVIVAGDDPGAVAELADDWSDFILETGSQVTWSETGSTLPGVLRGHEHFGFKDGISQPSIPGVTRPPAAGEPDPVPLGDFLLGYPDATGTTQTVSGVYENASMVVFRRLTQDVAGFREVTAPGVANAVPPLDQAQLQAKIIGRWPSGAPLEGNPEGDPGTASNAFAYQEADPEGLVCPHWAHLRKADPRDETTPDPDNDKPALHRMLRRGLPFGPPLPPAAGTTDDGVERGLHFLAAVADLDRQFEFIQSKWLSDPNFPNGQPPSAPNNPYQPTPNVAPDGADPIAGQEPLPNTVQLQQTSGSPIPIPFNQAFAAMTGGEYFLLPSVTTLRNLATPAASTSA